MYIHVPWCHSLVFSIASLNLPTRSSKLSQVPLLSNDSGDHLSLPQNIRQRSTDSTEVSAKDIAGSPASFNLFNLSCSTGDQFVHPKSTLQIHA